MADLTIASAATLTGAGTASGDLFPLLDVSAAAGSQGSKITRDELKIAMGLTGTPALLGTANVFTAAQTITSTVGASALTLNGGTQTSSFPALTTNQTWNNVATTFTGHLLNITNTASASTSLFQNFQLGGVSRFAVGLTGISRINDGSGVVGSLLMSGGGTYLKLSMTSGAVIINDAIAGWGTNAMMSSNIALSWCPAALTALNPDTFVYRKAAAAIQMGADAAPVTNQMFTAASRITSDGVGANLTIAGGNGRGGAGGSLILSTYDTAGAATIGTLRSRLVIDTTGVVSFPVVTAVTTETVVSDTTWPVTINGVSYKICLKA